jgi:hypothetical protein
MQKCMWHEKKKKWKEPKRFQLFAHFSSFLLNEPRDQTCRGKIPNISELIEFQWLNTHILLFISSLLTSGIHLYFFPHYLCVCFLMNSVAATRFFCFYNLFLFLKNKKSGISSSRNDLPVVSHTKFFSLYYSDEKRRIMMYTAIAR